MSTIEINNIIKVFGKEENKALQLIEEGYSKDEILEQTGMTVGINQASFTIENNEMFVIMGLSGSGKSTLLRTINRLIEPTAGEIIIDQTNINELSKKEMRELRRNKFGMVFQDFSLFPFRTVLENTYFGLEIQNLSSEEMEAKAQEALKKVGLEGWGDKYPDELSGGMQQRVGLARALAIDPDILLMDEPFSALDPLIKKEMQDLLLEIYEDMDKTIIFITHDLDEALRLGDTIAIMRDGEVEQVGSPEEILTNSKNDYIAEFVRNVNRAQILTAEDIMVDSIELAYIDEGPNTVRYKMKRNGISSIFVVGKKHKLKGYVTIEDVNRLIAEEKNELASIVKEAHAVELDTPINDLFEEISQMKIPFPVVEDGYLKGIIVKATILANLS